MLSSFITKLLLTRQFSMSEKEVKLLGKNFYLQPLSQLVLLQEKLQEKFGEEGAKLIYEAGKASLLEMGRELQKFSSRKYELLEVMVSFLRHFGLGDIQLLRMDERECRVEIEIKENPFVKEYLKLFGVQPKCVDLLLAGMLSGFFSVFFKRGVECKEKSCMGRGNPVCMFVIKPANNFHSQD